MRLASALLLCVLGACSKDVDLGEGRDAGTFPPRSEECGNGVDDDADGRIDDGCPCGPGETQTCSSAGLARGLGACAVGGTQTCVASVEWGDWGDAPCVGAVAPATEACDGADRDCDGSVDEGCPCTDGAQSVCGGDLVAPPCRAGAQTCRAGAWSSCEGAVGPVAEVCGDDVDNDCDGEVDDARLCACEPRPERCGNAVDDDCDGLVDEPACLPDLPDASMPDGSIDGSLDAAMPDGGTLDGGGGSSCAESCSPMGWRDLGASVTDTTSTGSEALSACATPGGGAAVVIRDGSDLRLFHLDAAGATVASARLGRSVVTGASRPGGIAEGMVCLEDRFAIVYRDDARQLVLASFDYAGALVAGPTVLSPLASGLPASLTRLGAELYVVFVDYDDTTTARVYSRRFDTDLRALGSAVVLAPEHEVNNVAIEAAARASDVVATATLRVSPAGFSEQLVVSVRGDTPGTAVVVSIPRDAPGSYENTIGLERHLRALPNGPMALCYKYRPGPAPCCPLGEETRCLFLNAAGEPTGPAQILTRPGGGDGHDFGLVADDCAFHVVTYCRRTTEGTPCTAGAELHVGDPTAGTWTRVGLPARPSSGDTLLGSLPLSTETIVSGGRLWHFGLDRSNGSGTMQLHDLRFECAP